MSNWKKTYESIMSGQSDANIDLGDAVVMLQRLGYAFSRHGGGSHRIGKKPGSPAVNLQNRNGYVAPYQVRQIRDALKNQIS